MSPSYQRASPSSEASSATSERAPTRRRELARISRRAKTAPKGSTTARRRRRFEPHPRTKTVQVTTVFWAGTLRMAIVAAEGASLGRLKLVLRTSQVLGRGVRQRRRARAWKSSKWVTSTEYQEDSRARLANSPLSITLGELVFSQSRMAISA